MRGWKQGGSLSMANDRRYTPGPPAVPLSLLEGAFNRKEVMRG